MTLRADSYSQHGTTVFRTTAWKRAWLSGEGRVAVHVLQRSGRPHQGRRSPATLCPPAFWFAS